MAVAMAATEVAAVASAAVVMGMEAVAAAA